MYFSAVTRRCISQFLSGFSSILAAPGENDLQLTMWLDFSELTLYIQQTTSRPKNSKHNIRSREKFKYTHAPPFQNKLHIIDFSELPITDNL